MGYRLSGYACMPRSARADWAPRDAPGRRAGTLATPCTVLSLIRSDDRLMDRVDASSKQPGQNATGSCMRSRAACPVSHGRCNGRIPLFGLFPRPALRGGAGGIKPPSVFSFFSFRGRQEVGASLICRVGSMLFAHECFFFSPFAIIKRWGFLLLMGGT